MKLSYGMDVSAFQTIRSWPDAARVVDFVVIKATEGHSYVSPAFAPYSAAARAAGLLVGSYHVASPPGSAAAEAHWYASRLSAAGWRSGHDLPPVLDVEGNHGLSRDQLTAWSRAFCVALDAELRLTNLPAPRRTGFYIGGSLAHLVDVGAIVRDRWYWGTPPAYRGPAWPTSVPAGVHLYQFTDRGIGVVPGITGNGLDLNVAHPDTLRALAPNHYPPAPAPAKPSEVPDVTPDQCRAIVREELTRALTVPTSETQRQDYGYAQPTYRLGSLVNDASWHGRLLVRMVGALADQLQRHDVAQLAAAADRDPDDDGPAA